MTTKIFLQTLWRSQLSSDDAISSAIIHRWELIYRNLSSLNGLQIPRWTGRDSDSAHCELHGFADASTVAYAAVLYMRVKSLSGEVTLRVLIAKSKVAPLKPVSVPRLELSAATLLARLVEFVQESLNLKMVPSYCWTDSTVALSWIKSHPSRWRTFIANRVADIQSRLPNADWRFVPTHENPAVCASRGLLGNELNSLSLW